MALSAGTTFAGRYEILGRLGAGAMGNVYRARHITLEKEIALKVAGTPLELEPGVLDDGEARFDREARAIARLDHPSIVRVLDYGRTKRHRFIAMQLLDGSTLSDVLADTPQLPEPLALRFTRQLLGALVHAHAHGILHRDLKPGNVMITGGRSGISRGFRPQRAVLIDFGLAFVNDEASLTARGACIGSPSYLAPERLEGGPSDARGDLYALGAMLYEMLAGRRPFVGDSIGEILLAARSQPAAPLRAIRPELSRPLEAFVARALSKDPSARFASAEAMLEALDDIALLERDEQAAEARALAEERAASSSTLFEIPITDPGVLRRLWGWLRYGRWRWRGASAP